MTKTLLRNGRRVSYSMREQRLFGLLSEKPKTTEKIADAFYGRSERPFNHRRIISGALINLAMKVRANREEFRLERSDRIGPYPISYWVERTPK